MDGYTVVTTLAMEDASFLFEKRALVTDAPLAAVTGMPVTSDGLLSIPITLATSTNKQVGSVFVFPTEASDPKNTQAFGNHHGGIDQMKDKSGLSTGAKAAISISIELFVLSIIAVILLYRRGYLNSLRRKIRSIDRSKISFPLDDKVKLTRFAAEPGRASPTEVISRPIGKDSTFVIERRVSVDSLQNGPQWDSQSRQVEGLGISGRPARTEDDGGRRGAPLPPTPAAGVALSAPTDWRNMHPPAAVPRMEDPFVDPEGDLGAKGRGAMGESNYASTMGGKQNRL